MKQITRLLLPIFLLTIFSNTRADEGMWIPILLEKYTLADMQKKGFKLTAEDIYSINQASLKDAIPIFGKGCTSGVISNKGLIITNHHCGFSQIQWHSTVEHDYITNGFWAMNQSQELVCPNLSVTFLVSMEDVTNKVLKGVSPGLSEDERANIIAINSAKLIEEATKNNHYEANVQAFFSGNDFYLIVTEVYKDIRLVGAPPSAIGSFGGDTDNWIWPRHTADFSLFRIYAGKDNKPAVYSPENVPFTPKKALDISLKPTKENDFTFILGYPGRTQEYISSFAVNYIQNELNPKQIAIRQNILDVMLKYMNSSPEIRIKYADQRASVSNSWKKWQGESFGLKKSNTIERKKQQEIEFENWLNNNEDKKMKYGNLLSNFQKTYQDFTPYGIAQAYFYEAGMGSDIINFVNSFINNTGIVNKSTPTDISETKQKLKKKGDRFFKDFDFETEKAIFENIFNLYKQNTDSFFQPKYFKTINQKYQGNFENFTNKNFPISIFTNQKRYNDFVEKLDAKSINNIEKEQLIQLVKSLIQLRDEKIDPKISYFTQEISKLNRQYMAAIREMKPEKNFYPDANFTMRLTYGSVSGIMPRDGINYASYTTIEGIIEKDNPEIYDYRVPQKLKDLFNAKDYGKYGQDGTVKVCFLASNHTSGGNSGSPVLNAEGQMIGLNFDRCWEGTMSDIQYNVNQCRNISLSMHYALFIIDKFANAGYLINEMNVINN